MKRLLLVEDDQMISRTLRLSLSYRGYEVVISETARDGRKKFQEEIFDVVILDVNLPDETGYSLCQTLRAKSPNVPILMLTARADENSAVAGIDAGADDYVRKPFGLEELTARLNRLTARHKKSDDCVSFCSLKLSSRQRLVWVTETPVALGKREFDILSLLINRKGEVVTRDEILKTLDTELDIYDRTIDSHLSHLRKKLKDADLKDVQITPVYGVGYRLEKK